MNVRVDVQTACDDDTVPEIPMVSAWITRAIDASGRAGNSEVSLRIVDPREIQALNKQYRGKDQPTNVLSFPAGRVAGLPGDIPLPLGDLVVCAGVVRDEAAEQGKDVTDHWAHMLVHGTLHLLGFDHQTDADAAEMEALETRILSAHGVADPYGASGET